MMVQVGYIVDHGSTRDATARLKMSREEGTRQSIEFEWCENE